MTASFTPRLRILSTVAISLVAAVLCLAAPIHAAAQPLAPNTTEWDSDALNLRLFYPSDLDQSDAAQVMRGGHFNLFGISGATDPKLAAATRCLRPLLLLRRPHSPEAQPTQLNPAPDSENRVPKASEATPEAPATILLAELDVACLSTTQGNSTTLLADMAEIVNKVPGMTSIAQPAYYTIGYQKVHMAAAQGKPQTQAPPESGDSPPQPSSPSGPSELFTMGLSTNWNNHLLVWYFSSNNIDTLNRLTKTGVRFGRSQTAPLYPVLIGTGAR